MFNYAKAYFRVCCSLSGLSALLYWPLFKNLPSVLATIFAGEADFQSRPQSKSLEHIERSGFLQGARSPRKLGVSALWSGEEGLLETEPRTRGFKIRFKERNKLADPNYHKGEVAWMTVDGEDGSFKISIASDGQWIEAESQWKYQVRQTDGKLYEGGKLVGEEDLNRNKQ